MSHHGWHISSTSSFKYVPATNHITQHTKCRAMCFIHPKKHHACVCLTFASKNKARMFLAHVWAGRQNQQHPIELRVNGQWKSLVARIKWDIEKSLTVIFIATKVEAPFTFIPATFKPPFLFCIYAPHTVTRFTVPPSVTLIKVKYISKNRLTFWIICLYHLMFKIMITT